MRRAAIIIPVLALAAAQSGCGANGNADEGGSEKSAPAAVHAQTARATLRPFTETVEAIGTVVPRPGAFAALSAPAQGRVARIHVAVGQRVRPGEPLVELEHAPFDAAARSAEVALSAAQRSYERAKRLVDEGISPRKEADLAHVELAQAEATLLSARRAQELATLRAPIPGVVTRLAAVLGQSVDAAQPLVEVADPSILDIVLAVSPTQAARIHAGDSVSLAAGSSASGEPLGRGVIEAVAAAVDSTTRTVPVRARLARPDRALRIGEMVNGLIAVATHPKAIAIPVAALVPDGEHFKVWVVDASGVAHGRTVSVGARTETEAEITKGLEPGDVVVTYGAYGMEDSARVVVGDSTKSAQARP
jgi:RND family efflux transporter MFP subunit